MIETPSLRTRVTLITVGVMVSLVVSLEAFVYLSLERRLTDGLGDVLTTRVALVERLAEDTDDLDEIGQDLSELGVPALLRAADGSVVRSEPTTTRLDTLLPGGEPGAGTLSRTVALGGGATAEVLVSRGGVDTTLQRILAIEAVGSVAALVLAAALLRRASAVVTRPLDRMVATATRIAEVDRHERLDPTDPTTELGRMAAAFDRTFDALDRALTEAEEAETRSRRFLADAAHQLRTPLAGLRASAEILLAHPDGPDRDRMVANVSREAARMSRLVDRLLRIARIDRGEQPELAPVDLGRLALDEIARQRPLAPDLAIELTAGPEPTIVSCDPSAVREALANLLDNARRHAEGRVEVAVGRSLGMGRVTVRDDGPGLAAAEVELVFDRFTTSSDGSGLGLPIARGIAEAHGGDLRWSDGRFVLSLPIAPLER